MRYGIALAIAFAAIPAVSQAATIDTFNCSGTAVQATITSTTNAAVSVAGGAAQNIRVLYGTAQGSIQLGHSTVPVSYSPASGTRKPMFDANKSLCTFVSSK